MSGFTWERLQTQLMYRGREVRGNHQVIPLVIVEKSEMSWFIRWFFVVRECKRNYKVSQILLLNFISLLYIPFCPVKHNIQTWNKILTLPISLWHYWRQSTYICHVSIILSWEPHLVDLVDLSREHWVTVHKVCIHHEVTEDDHNQNYLCHDDTDPRGAADTVITVV